MHYSKQHLTLLNALLLNKVLTLKEIVEDIEENDFYEFIRYYRISDYVYRRICEMQLSSAFSDQIVQRFEKQYKRTIKKVERLCEEIGHLSKHFGNDKIIFLKGPALALRFYQNISVRRIDDIDLLVRKETFTDDEKRLIQLGFSPEHNTLLSWTLAKKFTHHFEYKNQNISLDLHWAFRSHFSFALDYAAIWNSSQMLTLKGSQIRTLSEEYSLVFQILSIFTDIERGGRVLRSLIDLLKVAQYYERKCDWPSFFENRRKERIFDISVNILDIMLTLFECEQEFPKLNQTIKMYSTRLHQTNYKTRIQLLEGRRIWKNKLWAFRLYDAPAISTFFFWLISIPFKFLVYKSQSGRFFSKGGVKAT